MKLYIRTKYTEDKIEELRKYFDEIVYEPWTDTGERYYEDEMLKKLLEVKPDVLVTELDRVTEKVLSGYDGLKFIGDCRATPANIEIEACNKHKIPVLCTPGRNSQAVAEMVVGLLLTCMRNIIPSVKWIQDGKWVKGTTPYYTWMGNELYGKEVGFVGMGAIAKIVANILEAFGCKISFYDPFLENFKDYKKKDLNAIFKDSDIVTIHVPVIDSTHKMIKKEHFDLMKPTSIFVNVSRTWMVDMDAFYDTMKNNKIKAAITDVLDEEPPTEEALKIDKLPNVLLTPHICGATFEVANHQTDIINDRIIKFLEKKDLEKIVYNKEALQ